MGYQAQIIWREEYLTLISIILTLAITDSVIEEDVINDEESQLLKNLMKFNQIKVKSIMTPRVVVFAAEENTPIEKFYQMHKEIPFSSIPLYGKDLNQTSGFVLKDEFMEMIIKGKGKRPMKEIKRNIRVVTEKPCTSSVYSINSLS